MPGSGFGRIDYPELLRSLPEDPIALMALIVLVVAFLVHRWFKDVPTHGRLIALVLVLVAAGMAFYSLVGLVDGARVQPKELTAPLDSPKVSIAEPSERTRQLSFYDRNGHCAGSRPVRWQVRAEPGWSIDPTSIQPRVTVKSSNSHFKGVADPAASGFALEGTIRNNGHCGPFWKDARGALGVAVSFKETQL